MYAYSDCYTILYRHIIALSSVQNLGFSAEISDSKTAPLVSLSGLFRVTCSKNYQKGKSSSSLEASGEGGVLAVGVEGAD